MQQNNFKYWYSKETKLDNSEAMLEFEQNEGVKLPGHYKELVRFRDGGTLKKYIFTYENEGEIDENGVGFFLCWQRETLGNSHSFLLNAYKDPPEFFPKEIIPFAPDGGGNYVCFDYRNCKENPPIVFWHHAVEENEGIFALANSFDEFINNLKSDDEID